MEGHKKSYQASCAAYGVIRTITYTTDPRTFLYSILYSKKACCRGLYTTHTLSHGPISIQQLYSMYSYTVIQQLYSIHPLQHPSDGEARLGVLDFRPASHAGIAIRFELLPRVICGLQTRPPASRHKRARLSSNSFRFCRACPCAAAGVPGAGAARSEGGVHLSPHHHF